MPANMSHNTHPEGRPWKAQVSFKLSTTGVTKTVYLGFWPTKIMAIEAEEAYIRKHRPERTNRRIIWDEENQTNLILERVEENG